MLMADFVICQVKGGETLDWSNCYAPSLITCPFHCMLAKISLWRVEHGFRVQLFLSMHTLGRSNWFYLR